LIKNTDTRVCVCSCVCEWARAHEKMFNITNHCGNIKITTRYHHTPTRMAKIFQRFIDCQYQVFARIWNNWKSHIADRNAKCYSHFEKPSSTTLESKTCIYHIIFSIPLLGTCPRKINTYTHTKTYSQLRVSDVG